MSNDPELDLDDEEFRLTGDDKAAAKVWRQAKARGFAEKEADGGLGREDPHNGVLRLSVMRRYQPKAFQFLCRRDDLAASIAVRRSWSADVETQRRADPSPVEIEAVANSARLAVEALAAMHPVAPFSRAMSSPARPLGALTPEQIEAARIKVASPLAKPVPRPVADVNGAQANPVQGGSEDVAPIPPAPPPPVSPPSDESGTLPHAPPTASSPVRLPWEAAP